MKLSTLAVGVVAAALVVFAVRSGKQESTDANRTAVAAAPVSPVKTLTSESCASDGCPVSCEDGDTLLSAFCISGAKARFADTLKLAASGVTATCSNKAQSILVYCARP